MEQELTIFDLLGKMWGLDLGRYSHVFGSALVLIVLLVSAIFAWRKWRNPRDSLLPTPKFSAAHFYEVLSGAILNLLNGILGENGEKYLPLIGSLFLYLLACNLIGLFPGMSAPTANVNTNLSCALIVFFYYNYEGIRENGFVGYFRQMAGPVAWLAPLIFVVELISHLIRPFSLSIRLYGNMMGDHVVLKIFSEIVPMVVPMIFMLLDIAVALLQAFVFCLLSVIYIALARAKH